MFCMSGIFELLQPISEEEASKLHPMSLAFVGDAVQLLYARTRVTVGSDRKTAALHFEVTKIVKAVAQAKEAEALLPLFTETEADIFRRARNCKLQTSAKHAEPAEYHKASGLEAVLGFLCLTGNTKRLDKFLTIAFSSDSRSE